MDNPIREEIEKLRPIYKDLLVLGGETTTGLISRQAVLAILDRYEVMAEGRITTHIISRDPLYRQAYNVLLNSIPGDRIIILRGERGLPMKKIGIKKLSVSIKTQREHLIYEHAYAAGQADAWEWQGLRAHIHLEKYDEARKQEEGEK